MLILDTDHLSEIERASSLGQSLQTRLARSGGSIGTTIISVEEQSRGALASLKRHREAENLIAPYGRLQRLVGDWSLYVILPWNNEAVAVHEQLKAARVRIGTMDLRIASIVIANDATRLSRNLKDFTRVPNLRVENWLE